MKFIEYLRQKKHKIMLVLAGFLLLCAAGIAYIGWNTFIREAQQHVKTLRRQRINYLFKRLFSPFWR